MKTSSRCQIGTVHLESYEFVLVYDEEIEKENELHPAVEQRAQAFQLSLRGIGAFGRSWNETAVGVEETHPGGLFPGLLSLPETDLQLELITPTAGLEHLVSRA